MKVNEGFVPGRSRENARKVLAAAKKAGVDVREVRTVDGGYSVPAKVLEVLDGSKRTSSRKGKRPTNKETDNG